MPMKKLNFISSIVLVLSLFFSSIVFSDGGGSGGSGGSGGGSGYGESALNNIWLLIKEKKFEQAILELNEEDQNDADVANLLGFSNRKLKNYDEALKHYQRALSINSKHKGANEYLGELYLETGEIDKAKQQLAILDDICWLPCSEYTKLKKLLKNY